MPQAIALALLATAAATPAAGPAPPGGGSATGKAPFAGVLLRLGETAPRGVPTVVASAANALVDAGKPNGQLETQGEGPRTGAMTPGKPSAPSFRVLASFGKSTMPAGPIQTGQPGQATALTAKQAATASGRPVAAIPTATQPPDTADPTPASVEPTPAAVQSTPASAEPTPASVAALAPASLAALAREPTPAAAEGTSGPGQPTVSTHANIRRRPAAAPTTTGTDAIGTVFPTDAQAAMMPPPAPTPESPLPQPASGGDPRAGLPVGAVAAKSGAPRPQAPPGTIAPEVAVTQAAAPDAPAMPSGTAAPTATTISDASALPPEPITAASQATPTAVPVSLPDRTDTTSVALPDTAISPPAQQVSAALVSLGRTSDGSQSMTLRLEPPELGQVQIRIDRPQDAPASVDITVQRPETMTLLLRDQPQLLRALDQAGVPVDGRSVTLHVAPADSVAPSGGTAGTTIGADTGQGSGSSTGSDTRPGTQGNPDDAADPQQDDTPTPLARWLRAGLDITA